MRPAAAAFPSPPEGAAGPASRRLSVTQPPTPPPLPIGYRRGPGPLQPRPPRMDRPRGRGGGGGRVRPAVSYRGGPAGRPSLAISSLARALSLSPPVGKSGPPERPPPRAPSGSVPPARAPASSGWPRGGSGESPRRHRVVFKPC